MARYVLELFSFCKQWLPTFCDVYMSSGQTDVYDN